ncbi:hypothetical protein B7494_g3773 [Chlorociboria aeruginascens]|nr:hypothetical protein B7494_g3773 [Chlorociboria aeruginascens]
MSSPPEHSGPQGEKASSADLPIQESVPEDGEKQETSQDANESTSTHSSAEKRKFARLQENACARWFWNVVTWTPPICRWDPESPPKFSLGLNMLFAFAGTFTVANLYYNHPILNVLAVDFDVTYERISLIPTVMQAGYAAGLLFLCPLGDIFRRRAFVLSLVFFTATIWLGLCLTKSFSVFVALSFLAAVTTVTPQLMLPLVGDLAPPHRRATALSIVVSGMLGGMLIARLLSGILTQYTSWRSIYWFSFAMQYLIFMLLFCFMPDYPSTNPGGLNYFNMLFSIVKMVFKHPILVQACLVGLCTSTIFTNYWTTLTFLLSSPPYNYSPVTIGLFALVGIGAMCFGPFYSRVIIDRFVPLLSVVLGLTYCLLGTLIGTYIGKHTIAGPIIQAFTIDLGIQTSQIANRSAIFSIEPKARNRINTAYMVSVFCGQLIGTAVGNRLYAEALCVAVVRGPREKGWIGWRGGWSLKRRDLGNKSKEEPAIEQALDEVSAEEKGVVLMEGEKPTAEGTNEEMKEENPEQIMAASSR